jgi:hypothetical protein
MVSRFLFSLVGLAWILLFSSRTHAQQHKLGFQQLLDKRPLEITTFCVPNDTHTLALLNKQQIPVKYKTANWLFISTTPTWIDSAIRSQQLDTYYFEYAPPMTLADSTLSTHFITPVHQGLGNLQNSIQGENCIIGYVDQGIDWNHPDFKDENGKTRVVRYWDQTTNTGGTIPQPYNYGIVWDSTAINNGTCTSTEGSSAHGTTVAGMGSGNALANGTNKGVAPKSTIVVVESNFNLANWTLTVADACDYIFKVADTLGLPAVVNLSLGTYLGSHDGNDPASERMEDLLDEKNGRIIIAAAGNSGAQGKYHVHGQVDLDTSFVWFLNNTSNSAAFGPNKIYFDLWSDTSDATYSFALGANAPAPSYTLRGKTIFRNAEILSDTVILDTIYTANGNRIAALEIYTERVYGNFHMQVLFSQIDSTNYLFRFMTTGSGKYDLWSGAWMGLNNVVQTIPSVAIYPEIVHYHAPDSLQSIVSSWNCSEKIISVGNIRNRANHIDNNGNVYTPPGLFTPVGQLSRNSSKGPNRHNIIKPDVSATGDVSLTAAPLWFLSNPSNNAAIDSGGWHARNGGTSMAAPVVSGIAALYLEKCAKTSYADFKTNLLSNCFSDSFTGTTPNNAYGYGKPNAFDLLSNTSFEANISGVATYCDTPVPLTIQSSNSLTSASWSNGFQGLTNFVSYQGEYFAEVYNSEGCSTYTDTVFIQQENPLPMLPISKNGNVLYTLSFTNYQWTLNGIDIPGANGSSLVIYPPYGTYTCYCVSDDGCKSETQPFTVSVGLDTTQFEKIVLFPNPSSDRIFIQTNQKIQSIRLFSATGKEVYCELDANNSFSVSHLNNGLYHLEIQLDLEKIYAKITRM